MRFYLHPCPPESNARNDIGGRLPISRESHALYVAGAAAGKARSVAGVLISCRDTPAGCWVSQRDHPELSR
jgi:hypothetical protein